MQPYNGYMGKSSYLKSQMPAYKICRSLALDVVDEVLHKVFVLRLTRKDAEKMVRQLENRVGFEKAEKEQQEKGYDGCCRKSSTMRYKTLLTASPLNVNYPGKSTTE